MLSTTRNNDTDLLEVPKFHNNRLNMAINTNHLSSTITGN